MPDIRNDETVEAIAQAYTSNGHNKTQALISAGYDPVNADSGKGQRVYGNQRLIDAIAKIEAKTAEKGDYSRQGQLDKLEDIAEHILTSPAARVSAIRAQNSMLGYDQEKAPNEEAEQLRRKRITDEELAIAAQQANDRVEVLSGQVKLKTG